MHNLFKNKDKTIWLVQSGLSNVYLQISLHQKHRISNCETNQYTLSAETWRKWEEECASYRETLQLSTTDSLSGVLPICLNTFLRNRVHWCWRMEQLAGWCSSICRFDADSECRADDWDHLLGCVTRSERDVQLLVPQLEIICFWCKLICRYTFGYVGYHQCRDNLHNCFAQYDNICV